MSRIVHVFPNTDLRNGHDGLTAIAIKNKRNPANLDPGEFLFFLNTAQTAFRLLTANGVMVHWKAPDNRRVELRAIRHIPDAFAGKAFDFNIAVRASLKETLGAKRYTVDE